MLALYPVPGLAASIGLNVTLSSYHDQMDFGFMAYTSAIETSRHSPTTRCGPTENSRPLPKPHSEGTSVASAGP